MAVAATRENIPRLSKPLVLLLLMLGAGLWAWAGRGDPGPVDQWLVLPVALLVAAIPRVRIAAVRGLDFLNSDFPKRRAMIAVAVGITAGMYFLGSAWFQQRDLFPKYHDEFMYLIQARMLAGGRLWMPPHQLNDFLDAPYIFIQPVYAALCWPGTAMLHVPGLWMGLPTWTTSVIISASVVGLFFRIAAEMIGGGWGLLAALLLATVAPFRHQSVSLNAHGPLMLFGMLMVLAWLNWQRTSAARWGVLFGLAGGWAIITRPVDAICYALPICIAMAVSACQATDRPARLRIARAAVIAVLLAMPFVSLQLIFNKGVTGKINQTPFGYYCRRDYPQVAFGFPQYDPAARPQSGLIQKQILYQGWVVPFVIAHQPQNFVRDFFLNRIPTGISNTVAHPLLLILIPIGLLGLKDRRVRTLWLTLPLLIVLYACYTIFLAQYMMVVSPAAILGLLAGLKIVQDVWRRRTNLQWWPPVVIAALAVSTLPELTRLPDDPNPAPSIHAAADLPRFIHEPAVVLFRYRRWNPVHEEPVYNTDTAWPDDARIIRAHDLGLPKDAQIFNYYARHQPWREFYLFDRGDNSLHYLGNARVLAKDPSSAPLPPPTDISFP